MVKRLLLLNAVAVCGVLSAADLAVRCEAPPPFTSCQQAPDGSQIVRTYTAYNLASGVGKSFKIHWLVSGDPPAGYQLYTDWLHTEGDRWCSGTESSPPGIYGKPEGVNGWAQCYEDIHGLDKVTWVLKLQGHVKGEPVPHFPGHTLEFDGAASTTAILIVRYVPKAHQ